MIAVVAGVAEFSLLLWMLIFGVNNEGGTNKRGFRSWVSPFRANHRILFGEVDVLTWIEREITGQPRGLPCNVRAANRKTFREINKEIRAAQIEDVTKIDVGGAKASQLLPTWLFRPYFALACRRRPAEGPADQHRHGPSANLVTEDAGAGRYRATNRNRDRLFRVEHAGVAVR